MPSNHIRPKKSLGQNFLKDPHYIRKIVDAAQVSADDQVLEIGPGLGHLTRELSARAKTVLALELDVRLVPVLREEFAGTQNIEIVHADALEYPYDSLNGTWKVVANLPTIRPHHPAADSFARVHQFTLMLQKEVAELAPPLPAERSTDTYRLSYSSIQCRG
jgi:16S rRNA (adenine1518-N6/adenine1519-N6)-dimethyltransferase